MSQRGTLYIVATPLGNLEDMSFRAVNTLKTVQLIYAEDTRHSQPLLNSFQIKTPLRSLHEHNELERREEVISKLKEGLDLAFISDAGTPLISDPGYVLVKTVGEHGFSVVPIPGPSALITALCVSGLPTDRFLFVGFLPPKTQARQHALEALKETTCTLIFYESCHRVVDTLKDCVAVFGPQRPFVVARELTKTFETIYRGTTEDALNWISKDPHQQKGEFVLLVGGYEIPQGIITPQGEQLLKRLVKELPLKKASQITADITGLKKNFLYEYALSHFLPSDPEES